MEERQPKALTAAQSMSLHSAFSEAGKHEMVKRAKREHDELMGGNRHARRTRAARTRKRKAA